MSKPSHGTGHCEHCQQPLNDCFIRNGEQDLCLDCGERAYRNTRSPAEAARRTLLTNHQPELF